MLYPMLINRKTKRFFYYCIFLITVFLTACFDSGGSGGAQDDPFTWTDPLMPEISVTQGGSELRNGELYDFGNVPLAVPMTKTFNLANEGEGILVIHDIYLFDTDSLFSIANNEQLTFPLEIQQGENIPLTVAFKADEETANIENTVCIFSNDEHDAAFLIDVSGQSTLKIEYWDRRIDGEGRGDRTQAIAADGSGNVYVAGYGFNLESGSSNYDWWIKKYDSDGNELSGWDKKINGTGNDWDEATAIASDISNSRVYVLGFGKNLNEEVWLKQFSFDGTTGWGREIADPVGDGISRWHKPADIAVDSSGNVFIAGSSVSGSQTPWLKKYDSAGIDSTVFSTPTISGLSDMRVSSLAISNDGMGYVYIAGDAMNGANGTRDWWIIKLTGEGTLVWARIVTATGADELNDMVLDASGNIYIAGKTSNRWRVSKLRCDDGSTVTGWDRQSMMLESESSANALCVDDEYNVFAAGYGNNLVSGATGYDWWVRRLNPEGDYSEDYWNVVYDGSSSAGDDAVLALCAYSDAVCAVGYGDNLLSKVDPVSNNDWWIKKFYVDPVDE